MTRLVFASLLFGLSPWAMAAAEVADPSAVVATYPTGVAISDLGDFTQQELTDRARTALVRGGAYGGLQPGIAQAPAAGLYMALSIFMGGVDAPHDLTAPSEALK
jgi:hypothetical protein